MNALLIGLTATAVLGTGGLFAFLRSRRATPSLDATAFHSDEMTRMVCGGHTTETDAIVWLRTPGAGELRVTVCDPSGEERRITTPSTATAQTDHTQTVSLAEMGFQLHSGTRYDVTVHAGDELVGRCTVHTTSPVGESPEHFAIGIASCNNPFNDDGELSDQATQLLASAGEAWSKRDVCHAFMMGDQIYTDLPRPFSLFDEDYFRLVAPPGRTRILDCTAAEVRQLLHRRHRLFYKPKGLRELLSSVATHAILDDHELLDNWGSSPDHSQGPFAAYKEGGRAAFHDYQACRGLPQSDVPDTFDQSWSHGVLSVYLLDIRSNRSATADTVTIFSDGQLEAFEGWLGRQAHQHVIVLGLSVPFLHVPDWMADMGAAILGDDSDAADRWSYAKAHASRDALLGLLKDHMGKHPHQKLLVASGDIHVGCVNRIEWDDDTPPIYQIASSAITNKQSLLWEKVTELAPKMSSIMGTEHDLYAQATLLDSGASGSNPYGGLNIGLIEVKTGTTTSQVRMSLLGLVDERVEPVFESDWL